MFDALIKGGTVVDGTGRPPFRADVALKDGKVVEVRPGIEGEAAEVVDATGKLVLPGFVDIHTHYDGQATWDELLEPSSGHGVTTVVMGNCGVGFAPVRPGTEEWLIQLMEGVEDIPGTALSEGIRWSWESFGEYLDFLDTCRWSVDVAAHVPHGAVRGYVMGDRGARNEPATRDDIDAMARIVREAVEAGAVGVSTSRVLGHRAMDGEPVPGTFAAEDELYGLARAVFDAGGGVFELAPAGADGSDAVGGPREMEWMRRLSADTGVPVSFALLQIDPAPQQWRELMDASLQSRQDGANVVPLVAGRPFGMLLGLQNYHPLGLKPTYRSELAHLPLDEQVARLRDDAFRKALLAEPDQKPSAMFEGLHLAARGSAHRIYVMGDPPDYEPGPDRTLAAVAAERGVDPVEAFVELILETDGRGFLLFPLLNYSDGNLDAMYDQLTHPQAVVGLGDGGAHCGMICDASVPTFLLTHWARDRSRGPRLPIELLVRKQSRDTAALYGLTDRGTLEPGKRADLNVVDHEALVLHSPEMVHDLPAGGRRLLQRASGYELTMVAGEVTRRNGADTGARPGRLVRNRAAR